MRPKKSRERESLIETERESERELGGTRKEKVDVVQVALRTAKLTQLRLLLWPSQGRSAGGGSAENSGLGSETI